MRKCTIFLLLLILVLPWLLSCRQAEPVAPEEPIVSLLAPGDGSTLPTGDVQVRIYVQNFKMVQDTGQSNKPNEGHAIYYLDVSAPLKAGAPATTAPGTFVVSAETSRSWVNVPPGQHVFTVQLVNNDNTPLLPPATVRANVAVKNR